MPAATSATKGTEGHKGDQGQEESIAARVRTAQPTVPSSQARRLDSGRTDQAGPGLWAGPGRRAGPGVAA